MAVVALSHEVLGVRLQLLPMGHGLGSLGGRRQAHPGHEQARQQFSGAGPVIGHGQAKVSR